MTDCWLALISGRVQGVGFRHYTEQEARRLGISGWVRNLDNGSVEAVICGEASQIDTMKRWLHHGPSHASVTDIEFSRIELDTIPQGFSIRH